MKAIKKYTLLFVSLMTQPLWAGEVRVGAFSSGDLDGWEAQQFVGETQYSFVQDQGTVLRAIATASASGLVRKMTVNLQETPFLHWRWRVNGVLKGNNETSKAGDDYPARIYVVVSGGVFFWRTRAVNYVWSSHQPKDSTWANAYTDRARMIAVRSGTTDAGQWHDERRNVREDLRRLFGEEIREIDAIAIMTDTDNTGAEATAFYGDIYFSDQ